MENATGMSAIISNLNNLVSANTIFGVFADLMPWVATLIIACLGLYFLRKLLKGASKGKVKA